jgi:16S rRNA (cytidine1402-2'-O)-methyltransferase
MCYPAFRMPKARKPDNRQYLPDSSPDSRAHAGLGRASTDVNASTNAPMNLYHTHPSQKARISMIATPIGNLSDMTERGLTTLQNVNELWCEDTRHTQTLLNALGIARGHLRRVDQHISDEELKKLLANAENSGQWIGVVSDAGTPGVSDPGAKIAELLVDFPGIRLEAIPGASAVSAFISIGGVTGKFSFQGFFPRGRSEQIQLLNDLKDHETENTWIFFESPNRIESTLAALKDWCETLDFTPKFVLAKELTKLHENIWSGEGTQFIEWFQAQNADLRGEWVFSVKLPKNCVINKKTETDWEVTLECLIEAGVSTKDAAALISGRFLIAKKLAYQFALDHQNKIQKIIKK